MRAMFQDSEKPLAHVHFTAEGEVTFKSILYVPKRGPYDMFQNYGKVIHPYRSTRKERFDEGNAKELLPGKAS